MQKRIVIKNGKKFIVNAPCWSDGVGSGAPQGTLWMMSTDNKWYPVNVSGSAPNIVVYVSQSALTWQSPSQDAGNQLLLANNGNSYLVYLSGSVPNVNFYVSQTPFNASPKLNLLLSSVTDGKFYVVALNATSGSIGYTVDNTNIKVDNTTITADNSVGGTGSGSISTNVNQTPIPSSIIHDFNY